MTKSKERLRPDEAARHLGLSPAYLYKLRAKGGGPPFHKIGSVIVYDVDDLDIWLANNKFTTLETARRRKSP